jgi:radical SAM protein with 4Fe4S-binding SPASM domain
MRSAGKIGVKSIAIIGEAEPLINPNVYEAIITGSHAGIDMALASNIILWKKNQIAKEALGHLKWLRINISAASDSTFRKIHNSNQFNTAIDNIKHIVELKKKNQLDVTIGLQMVLTPDNLSEVVPLAKLGKKLNVDYFVVKQCSDLPDNSIGVYNKLEEYKKSEYTNILKTAEQLSTSQYSVIIKWPQIQNEGKRSYTQCLGAPFLLHIAGDGRVYSCANFYEHPEYKQQFLLGDITKDSFESIVNSEHYWQCMKKILTEINTQCICQSNCRTNSINEFLHNYTNPPQHLNFI